LVGQKAHYKLPSYYFRFDVFCFRFRNEWRGMISNEKLGLMHPLLLPKASFLVPTITYTISFYQTADRTVDMIAHVMENYLRGGPILKC